MSFAQVNPGRAAYHNHPPPLASGRDRSSPYARLCDRWQETISLYVTAAANTPTARASSLIYDPFRVDQVWIESDRQAGSSSARFLVAAAQTDDDQTARSAAIERWASKFRSTFDPQDSMTGAAGMGPIYSGQIIRRVPARLWLLNDNALGVVVSVQALITITHLELEPTPDPPSFRPAYP